MHWIEVNVLTKALQAAVYTLSGGLVTTLILVPFRKGLKKIWRAVDSLDPRTPTGVTQQLSDLQEQINTDPGDIPLKGMRRDHRVR